VAPALALPLDKDPAAYHWPLAGRCVAIYGALDIARLRRLLAPMLRDSALIAADVGMDGIMHVASIPVVEDVEDAA
jgi:hypothetical protein